MNGFSSVTLPYLKRRIADFFYARNGAIGYDKLLTSVPAIDNLIVTKDPSQGDHAPTGQHVVVLVVNSIVSVTTRGASYRSKSYRRLLVSSH